MSANFAMASGMLGAVDGKVLTFAAALAVSIAVALRGRS